MGLTTPHRKNHLVEETTPEENRTDSIDDGPTHRTRTWNWKVPHRIGTWNVRSLNKRGALEEMESEALRYKLDLLALQEVRRPGFGTLTLKKGTLLYSGRRDGTHTEGIGFYLSKELHSNLVEFEPINSRIAKIRLIARWFRVTIIAVHAPTDVSNDHDKDAWYDRLVAVIEKTPRHDMLIVLGDWNAQVGREAEAFGEVSGTHSLHARSNDNGVRMQTFAMQQGLIIGSTCFPHKNIHKGTWISPDGNTINQIDHVLINRKFRSALQDARSYRGADCDSDHLLVIAKIKIRLCKGKAKSKIGKKYDVSKLAVEETRQEYQLAISNRFAMLREEHIDIEWTDIKQVVKEAAVDTLGFAKKKKNMWFDEECERVADARRKDRIAWLENRDIREMRENFVRSRNEATATYKRKKKESMRRNISEIEQSRRSGRVREQYQGIKEIKNGYQPRSVMIKDKEGELIMNEDEVKARWKDYFQELLNRPDPEDPMDDQEAYG